MDQLGDIRTFISVVEAGGISAAANQLNLAKSAVSRRIAQLETITHAELFRRGNRKLELTDSGKTLYERAIRIVQDFDEAVSLTHDQATGLSGKIRLGAPVSFGTGYLSEALADFSIEHPKVSFDINLDDRHVDLIERNLDLALRIGDQLTGEIVAKRLSRIHQLVCASPTYWDIHGRPKVGSELQQHKILRYASKPQNEVSFTNPDGNIETIAVSVTSTIDNGEMLRTFAIRGLGVLIEPSFIVSDAVRRGELEVVLKDHNWSGAQLFAIYPPTRHLSHRVRVLIDYLADRFHGSPPWDEGLGIEVQ
jgi:DNA-binding transcriptional LysR family regulator